MNNTNGITEERQNYIWMLQMLKKLQDLGYDPDDVVQKECDSLIRIVEKTEL